MINDQLQEKHDSNVSRYNSGRKITKTEAIEANLGDIFQLFNGAFYAKYKLISIDYTMRIYILHY